jgi:hypothetical protein
MNKENASTAGHVSHNHSGTAAMDRFRAISPEFTFSGSETMSLANTHADSSRPSSSATLVQPQRPATAIPSLVRPGTATKRPSTAMLPPPSPLARPETPSLLDADGQTRQSGIGTLVNTGAVNTIRPSTSTTIAETPVASFITDLSAGLAGMLDYTLFSDSHRHAMMEKQIIACIKDDNFAKLVDDLEGNWQRIGLDLHLSQVARRENTS